MDASIHRKERRITGWLAPYEAYIIQMQSALSWESPLYTGLVLAALHVAFALVAIYGLKPLFLLPATFLAATVMDMWKNYIWPTIRVPPEFDEDCEDWTPVSARAMSVPEISLYMAKSWQATNSVCHRLLCLRRDCPQTFAVLTSLMLSVAATVSLYVPGIAVMYCATLTFFAWPAAVHYGVADSITEMVSAVSSAVSCVSEADLVPPEPPVTHDVSEDEDGMTSYLPTSSYVPYDGEGEGEVTLREQALTSGLPTRFPTHDHGSSDTSDIDDLPLDEGHYEDDEDEDEHFLPTSDVTHHDEDVAHSDALNYDLTRMVTSGVASLFDAATAATATLAAAAQRTPAATQRRQSSNESEFEIIDPDEVD